MQENVDVIMAYSSSNSHTDLKLEPIVEEETMRIRLKLNDGAKVRASRRESAYLVWIVCADLPPKRRSSFANITLCALWCGFEFSDWDFVFNYLKNEISQPAQIVHENRKYDLKFTTTMLIADLTCSSQLLKIKQFNGYYKANVHSYSHKEKIVMRDPSKHTHHSSNLNDPELETRGIRWASTLFAMIENLPLSSPIDTMHQALNGVACDFLKILCETLSCVPEVDPWIKDVSLPSDFTRALRPCSRLSVFKASELKDFLLY